jgi:crotonobetainyl-CoA:carnitine CoA-transferase CaiB-like acyl-CoA transferase
VPLRAAPALGAHTREVLRDDLGLDDAAIAALCETGAVVAREDATP